MTVQQETFPVLLSRQEAQDIHTLCTECTQPSCTFLDCAPVCQVCGKSRHDVVALSGFTVYQVGRRLVCGPCLEAEARAEKRREKVTS